MLSHFNLNQPGFSRFIGLSLVAHAVILICALFIVKGEPKRTFYTPVYTHVELVAPPKAKPKPKPKPKPAVKKPKPKPKPKPIKKTPVKAKPKPKPKPKAIALKKEPAPPPVVEEKVSVEDSMAKLQAKLKKQEEDQLIAERMEDLRRKAEYEEKRNKRELAELKREIEELEKERTTVAADVAVPLASASADSVSSELFELEFKAYYSKVGSRIQSLWIYAGEYDKGLETLITIKINHAGALIDYWIEKRSGNSFFDESAIKAVAKAAPFPSLPVDIEEDFLEIGLRFCPGGCPAIKR